MRRRSAALPTIQTKLGSLCKSAADDRNIATKRVDEIYRHAERKILLRVPSRRIVTALNGMTAPIINH
jgi:hypothetical protein